MTTHLGQEGIIKIQGETVAQIRSWTLNTAAEIVEASTLNDRWKVHHATIKSWHGSLSCYWNEEDVPEKGKLELGNSVELTLYPSSESYPYFKGTILITGLDYSANHNGLVEANCAFQGTGPLEHKVEKAAVSSIKTAPSK